MTVAPIREWPGALTPSHQRQVSKFKTSGYENGYRRKSTPLSSTLEVLDRELNALRGKNAELLVAIAPSDFRLDGLPRATARAEHPGVILSFDSTVGHLSYPCDTFTTWQDNLRAIALALEALRKVDRYGVTKRGEQYRGFLELEATAAPAGFSNLADALAFLYDVAGNGGSAADVLRRAQRKTHPDMGGDSSAFQRVSLAEAVLRREGALA